MSLERGHVVEGLYEIIDSFTGGGMGCVYRARHRTWNIEVAIKQPRKEFMQSHEQVKAFHKECSTWADIGLHPYVATCFYSRQIDGLPSVVAEYLPGGSLQDEIGSRALYAGDESHCLARMLTIAASTAWGLARAHEAHLIHCDVKPGNMLLTSCGTAKISDFGLAICSNAADGPTKQNWMTESFAAPEQLRQQDLTTAVDVWGWAASMLAMFMGGVSWENGAARGAALREFVETGSKAYRIPPMPGALAVLLKECFQFSPAARPASLEAVAERVCRCFEDLFDDVCPAGRSDLELISADSLNNRAVSKFDLGDHQEVRRLLNEAVAVDPLHPEANFNLAWLEFVRFRRVPLAFIQNLERVRQFDLGEYRPWLYSACLKNLGGQSQQAAGDFAKASEIVNENEILEVRRYWELSKLGSLNLVLAPPISGEDFAHDSLRFERLMSKAEAAIREGRLDDVQRYLLMSGDLPGFGRHPRRRRLMSIVGNQQ